MVQQLTRERPGTDTPPGADTETGAGIEPVPAWFVNAVFGTLPRSDQRRCAKAYLRALLTSPGRKTVRAMASSTTDLQALQQFVNQSPWDWRPPRRALTRLAGEWMNPRATVLELALIPKYGEQIVGVHRRPTPTGGSVNCQIALGMFLTERDRSLPVDWRLYLNRAWGEDETHRRRARIPEGVRRRPLEELALDLLDGLPEPRRGRGAPVILDLRGTGDTARAAAGLMARGAGFLLSLGAEEQRRAPVLKPPVRGPLVTLNSPSWLDLPDGTRAGRFRLLAEWSPARDRPRRVWLTNMLDGASSDFLALLRLKSTSGAALAAIGEDYGMSDFTGRSFPGWHHHMTLVSAAYAVDTLELADLAAEPVGDEFAAEAREVRDGREVRDVREGRVR
ncbi:transposase [Streptomyces sp.]|uniref:IS701 family transposase n=1 Tax=Streptomyces sp. TaxID=1931 RepID=UPI002810AB28|nr:transposase [Streptomyces sp.]